MWPGSGHYGEDRLFLMPEPRSPDLILRPGGRSRTVSSFPSLGTDPASLRPQTYQRSESTAAGERAGSKCRPSFKDSHLVPTKRLMAHANVPSRTLRSEVI